MWDYLTGTKQTLRNVFNNAIQGRSQDFPLEEGGGSDCFYREMFPPSREVETYQRVLY